jgi:hypothetical protein
MTTFADRPLEEQIAQWRAYVRRRLAGPGPRHLSRSGDEALRAELTDTMAMTLGGRAAEEIVFGEVTTGASNDLEKVTATAKQMVMRFGMSERLGPRVVLVPGVVTTTTVGRMLGIVTWRKRPQEPTTSRTNATVWSFVVRPRPIASASAAPTSSPPTRTRRSTSTSC